MSKLNIIFLFNSPDEDIVDKLVIGYIYKFVPKLSQVWTYSSIGPHRANYGPDLLYENHYNAVFLGLNIESYKGRKGDFGKFLLNEQVLYIPRDELLRCDIFVYDEKNV